VNSRAPAPRVVADLAWMGEAREVRHPVSQSRPLWVRHMRLLTGGPLPQPSVPHPEWHPYCEFNCNFEGRIMQYVAGEKMERESGDFLLLGGGIPHYATHHSYPQRSATIYFLPLLLFELGPEGDGARVLARFSGAKRIADRIVRPSPDLAAKMAGRFEEMVTEFAAWAPGSELRLRSLLIENLVDLLRWEAANGREIDLRASSVNWLQVERALRFIQENYAEPLYIAQIARAAGLSVAQLQLVFQTALGMSCIQYLRSYRISHAAALLCAPGARVTDVALAAGFETLSHFNTSFHKFLGMSPTQWIKLRGQRENEPAEKP
jgi:AraC-like DNA-binding protein